MVNNPVLAGFATTVLVAGGLGFATTGIAHANVCSNCPSARPSCAPPEGPAQCYDSNICSQEWCPNMGPMRRMPNWDMTVCHAYYFAPDSGLPALIIQGQPPGAPIPRQVCPPIAFMCP